MIGAVNLSQGFDSDYFWQIQKLESRNFWFCSRNRLILWALKKFFPQMKSFLEVGCGTGFVLSAIEKSFPETQISGSDLFSEGLSFAKKRLKNASLFQMDARQMPYREEYDVIGAFDVLEHVLEDECVLNQFHQGLKKGGGLILTVPQHAWLWSSQDEVACHKRRYTCEELTIKLKKSGFRMVWVSSFMALLLPFMFVSRIWLKKSLKSNSTQDILSEFKIARWINWIFERVCDVEMLMIAYGLSFPFGGSLVCVAEKINDENTIQ